MNDLPVLRSVLFVPGNRPDRVDKALRAGADAVVIDLEDTIPVDEKVTAREAARDKLLENQDRLLFVRINSADSAWVKTDLETIVGPHLKALVFPKVSDPSEIDWLDQELCRLEAQMDLPPAQVKVFPLIETARGVRDVNRIFSAKTQNIRLWTAFFGAADFTADMGIDMTFEAEELKYVRARLAIACRAARLEPPIDTPFMLDIKDLEACAADALRAKGFGFQGKQCIHPLQVDVVNKIFAPTEKQISEAKRIVAAYQKALDANSAAVQLDGKFIDPPIVERAKKTLKWIDPSS